MRIEFKLIGPVEIPQSTVHFWLKYRQRRNAHETGGAIAGYRSDGTWVLSSPMPPSSKSKAGRNWLRRDRSAAQGFVNRAFKTSQGQINYLGEWHTHPEPHPKPSPDDFKMLKDLLRTSKLEIDFLIGVIVGEAGELCVWVETATGKTEVVERIEQVEKNRPPHFLSSIWKKIGG